MVERFSLSCIDPTLDPSKLKKIKIGPKFRKRRMVDRLSPQNLRIDIHLLCTSHQKLEIDRLTLPQPQHFSGLFQLLRHNLFTLSNNLGRQNGGFLATGSSSRAPPITYHVVGSRALKLMRLSQDRLRGHASAFDSLLSLIPAKMYYGEDTSVRLLL